MKRDEKRLGRWMRTTVAIGVPVFFFSCYSRPEREYSSVDIEMQFEQVEVLELASAKLEPDEA